MKRRSFLGLGVVAGVASLFGSVPSFSISNTPRLVKDRKVRVALIGCGCRMGYGLLRDAMKEDIVIMCDCDTRMIEKTKARMKAYDKSYDVSKIKVFRDYREMFEKASNEIDAVIIATPNHHHALPSLMAIRRGIHVYVEKPMALTIEEVRLMAEEAKKYGVITQVGNHGHSSGFLPSFKELVESDELGTIKEAWCFNDRLNAMPYRPKSAPPPQTVDWDLWCGGSPICDYYPAVSGKHGAIHPHDFHSWIGYGNGSIGNMGTHIIDPACFGLDLYKRSPEKITLTDVAPGCKGSWTVRNSIEWAYKAEGKGSPFKLYWFDGVKEGVPYDQEHVDMIGICKKREYQNLPPIIEETEKRYGASLGQLGTLFVADNGVVFISQHCQSLQIYPKDLRKKVKDARIPKKYPRVPKANHMQEFFTSCRTGVKTGCDFEYSAPLAELVLQGNVLALAGKGAYEWNGKEFTTNPSINSFIKKDYRKGWEIW
ncbi:MAG: Gfo/Idh/MocA family oxidoreductase [Kiritimatiellae bacterium]|nr:Gfo/Idh/MocA family oxidoreductase [Kiritimatiellia bacterium]